ncbi:hypothetical protein ACPCXE_20345, partial [Bacillus velezensis]
VSKPILTGAESPACPKNRVEWAFGLGNDGKRISENTTNLYGDGTYGDTKTLVVGRGEQTENFTMQIIHFGKASEGY